MTVPDSIEPYLGWKALIVCYDGKLHSPQLATEWPVGTRLEAECTVSHALRWEWVEVQEELAQGLAEKMRPITFGTLPPMPRKPPREGYTWFPQPEEVEVKHEVVDPICSCGIYAVKHPSQCWEYLKQNTVLAQVAVWGKTRRATHGVRGQYAYPQKLITREKLAERAALAGELYGVPVEINDKMFVPMPVFGASPRNQHQASLAPLTLSLLVSSFAAILALFGHGSFLLSTLSAALVITAIVYTKFG